ncbi:MAG: hypothetical protein ACK4PR_02875 [Gammaproteobacteria bacterium]
MTSGLKIVNTGASSCAMGHIGSVADVIAGRLPTKLATRRFSAPDYAYGFELASSTDKYALGEAIIINDICYTTATNKEAASYFQLTTSQDFITGGIFIIPRDCNPGYIADYHMQAHTLSFEDFYLKLYQAVKKPLAFVALVEFDHFHSVAVGRPPINDKPIFDNMDYYYPFPPTLENAVSALVIGALTDYNDPALASINKQLGVVLYHNPMDDKIFPLTHHAHALTLNQMPTSLLEVTPAMAKQVRHLLIENSTIRSIHADVYPIHAMKDLFPL